MSKKIPALLLLLLQLFSCSNTAKSSDSTTPENYQYWSIIASGDTLDVEVPVHRKGLGLGLMWRKKLPDNSGMLFVFKNEQTLTFWMKNTYIPLDIAFIDSRNIIVNIEHMTTIDNDSLLYSSRQPSIMALEVNAGWFASHGVREGDTLTILRSQPGTTN